MAFWICGVLILLLDRWTKYLVVKKLSLGQTLPVIEGFFHLTHVQNSGAAFGLFADKRWFFIIITLFILFVIFYLQYTVGKNSVWLSIILGLLFGGAAGNFIDRLKTGFVIDFIDFRGIWSYVFNLADVAIVLGMILLAWHVFIVEKS